MVVPDIIPIVYEPSYRTDTIGRYNGGQFLASATYAHELQHGGHPGPRTGDCVRGDPPPVPHRPGSQRRRFLIHSGHNTGSIRMASPGQ